MDVERYGPWALIIGGSEGVGAAFARKLAGAGFGVVLVARKQAPLDALEAELAAAGAEVRTIPVDMSRADALDRVRAVTDDLDIGLLVYNAGANNIRGNLVELAPEVYRSVIGVTVVNQTEFAHHYGSLMRPRGRGGMILAGSMAGYMGAATLAPYCGAKAYSRIFSEALWIECAPMGVDVLHLAIGFTATPAMERLGIDVSAAQSPESVAQEGLDNIANGPVWIVGGERNQQVAIDRSRIVGRAEAMRTAGTPRRDQIPATAAG